MLGRNRTKRCTQAAESALSQWSDHRGGWVIASVHLAEFPNRGMLLFHLPRSQGCAFRSLVSAYNENISDFTRVLPLTAESARRKLRSSDA
jgi:hypothetical protein